MGKPTGFLEHRRQDMPERDRRARLADFHEIFVADDEGELRRQGARCMDCGVPFCQAEPGCPLDNLIPEWNDRVYSGHWRDAYDRLVRTNNFPEWTGRICPAPCETACVLGLVDAPVAIKRIERAIADRAFEEGWVRPRPPPERTGRRVAIIGSGPAGLAAADQLNQAGHSVTVFEREARAGGLLVYGVPTMKLDKRTVARRVEILAAEGIEFVTGAHVGVDVCPHRIRQDHDAVLLACGALRPRVLNVPGRDLAGVHFALDYLREVTRGLLDDPHRTSAFVDAAGLAVVVIGGGDTGADCVATALRQRCRSLANITRREREPDAGDLRAAWPAPPPTYTLDYAHQEHVAAFGRDPRQYGVLPVELVDDGRGRVAAVRFEWLAWDSAGSAPPRMRRTSEFGVVPADLVFIAIGYTGHDAPDLVRAFGVREERGLVRADFGRFQTDAPGVFAAGDMRRGQSLVVWAMAEGRGAARAIDHYLAESDRLR